MSENLKKTNLVVENRVDPSKKYTLSTTKDSTNNIIYVLTNKDDPNDVIRINVTTESQKDAEVKIRKENSGAHKEKDNVCILYYTRYIRLYGRRQYFTCGLTQKQTLFFIRERKPHGR